MMYKIEKWNDNGIVTEYGGGYTEEDVKAIVKGYKKDELISDSISTAYTREGSQYIYFVTAE